MAHANCKKLMFRKTGGIVPAAGSAPAVALAAAPAAAGFSMQLALKSSRPSASRAQNLRFQASGAGRSSAPSCICRKREG